MTSSSIESARACKSIRPCLSTGRTGYAKSIFLQVTGGVQYGLVLDRRGDPAARLSDEAGDSEYRLVVSFGSPTREDDFIGGCGDKVRNMPSSQVHGPPRLLAKPVDAGRIAVTITKIGEHLLQDFGMEPCGGIVVKIDAFHA